MKSKIRRYRLKGKWYEYKGFVPDTVDAVELNETMTLKEIEEIYGIKNIKVLLQPNH